jgi:hypothetical protein
MAAIESRYAADAVPDGTVNEGRKGIAYLRDYFVPANASSVFDDGLVTSGDNR